MPKPALTMQPAPGERVQRFVGDRLAFTLSTADGLPLPGGWRARLRTDLGRAEVLCKEIIQAHAKNLPGAGEAWQDLPMTGQAGKWSVELPLIEPGYFNAKAYLIDPQGWQHWPDGPNVRISVHPDNHRTANTIYCAFTRLFGETRAAASTEDKTRDAQFRPWDAKDYTIIPPSGKFRDLARQLPHITDQLGCRIIHLLPVNPTPTTYARYGRFGSPYASLDLTAIDPALVEFDRRTTGVDQFCELTYAAHLKNARIFLDIVINHTGWGSDLQENHPEWFTRGPDGGFVSPGAWGTVWEDLAELKHDQIELWDHLAQVFLTWCERGVDGFRCDAGYKVPVSAWQYITARVRQKFPGTIFLLEGLGGPWAITEQLMVEGGMQWAYSELFQNYGGRDVAAYLDYCLPLCGQVGLYVHYSETHDNDRLAKKGRNWSLMRNRLCALTSASGGYGITCGVEWLATEQIRVHGCTGLAWGNPQNLIAELSQLNRLLSEHPCFFDGAKLTRLSAPDSPVYALRRDSDEGKDSVLVLVNNDVDQPQTLSLAASVLASLGSLAFELTGQPLPPIKGAAKAAWEITLAPGAAYCLAANAQPQGLAGAAYQQARAQAAWAFTALGERLPIHQIPAWPWRELARLAGENPAGFLGAISSSDAKEVSANLELVRSPQAGQGEPYAAVVVWKLLDRRRILPVPPGHWLLITDSARFRARLSIAGEHFYVESIPVKAGHAAYFSPEQAPGDAELFLERYGAGPGAEDRTVTAAIRFLAAAPTLHCAVGRPLAISNLPFLQELAATPREVTPQEKLETLCKQPIVLLTNGIGGMARLCLDFGVIKSKYDCLLGANLHASVPVDRHVFAKRARLWLNADGFISALDLRNLIAFEPGPPAVWHFLAIAGDGRSVEIKVTASMLANRNTTVLHFSRGAGTFSAGKELPQECDVRLTVRVDIEDRSYHAETKRNGGTDYHFSTNTKTLEKQSGFVFTPAPDRQLRVFSQAGVFHPEVEWCLNIPHPIEQSRGQMDCGDAYSPGWFELPMVQGADISLVVCADAADPSVKEIQNSKLADQAVPSAAEFPADDEFGRQLLRAAHAFVVRRGAGVTVIAGYPWFLDWGRDSLICARGLISAGMTEEVKQLLLVFGRFVQNGTLPNTIQGEDASNRDTSDAPLWYGIVCEELAERGGPEFYQTKVDETRTLLDVLVNIASNYSTGTPNGIRMDADSGLIWSPSHFTWMDTNFPAGTPREGYPVEIQVLWIRLLRQLERVTMAADKKRWGELAAQAMASLNKYFWMEERGYFADLLVAKRGQSAANAVVDNSLRSNYLFAVSLGLVSGKTAQRCVTAALDYLVLPGALRTIAPLPVSPPLAIYGNQGQLLNNPPEPYWGRYEGDEDTRRKPAYHNGTAWTWTFPIFCEALVRAWDASPAAVAAARSYLGGMDQLLMEGCIGQMPEIVDGDAPHDQRGCDAQAWGVTEALRVWKFLQGLKK